MAFGSSANTNSGSQTFDKTDVSEVFLNTKEGIRVFRIMPGADEVKIKRQWLALNTDGTWEPFWKFNPADKRRKTTVIVAYWDTDLNKWVGDESYWRNNPIDQFVASLDEEDREGKFAQERFYLNILDITPVKQGKDGIVYPDTSFQYPGVSADVAKSPVGKVRILEGSSGELERENKKTGKIEAGKSMYAILMRATRGVLNQDGDPVTPYEYDMRLTTTGSGIGTVYEFRPSGDPKPLAPEYAALPIYDLKSWLKPYPNAAIDDLMSGRDYNEVIKEYSIQLFPKLIEDENPF